MPASISNDIPTDTELRDVVSATKGAIAQFFDASVVAHDMAHLDRVLKVADEICISEGGNRTIVAVASLLHDYHRLLEKQYGRHVSPEEAEPEIRAILARIPLIAIEMHDAICDAINFTEHYRCAGDDIAEARVALEARIVRDADMLDALGAIGIARAFMFGGFLRQPIWVPDEECLKSAKQFEHGKTTSTVHHFYEKLLKLESEMLTARGRALAADRSGYMNDFIARLMVELG